MATAARVTHLVGGPDEHASEGVGLEAGGDVAELRLEEHETQRVFERLHVGVGAEPNPCGRVVARA